MLKTQGDILPSFHLPYTRARFNTFAMPVIAMTAHALQGDREKCIDAGMDDYIPKPIEREVLSKTLGRWLAGERGLPSTSPTAAKEEAAIPVFDRTGPADRLMGNEALISRTISIFLEDMPGRIKALKGHAIANDAENSFADAHSIKGSAANIGGEVLHRVALEIERAGLAGDTEKVRAMTPQLEARFDELRQTMI